MRMASATRCNYHAEAYIYSSLNSKEKTYYDTAAERDKHGHRLLLNRFIVVSYAADNTDPIIHQ